MRSISSGSTYRKRNLKSRYVCRHVWAEVSEGPRFAVYFSESEQSDPNSKRSFQKKPWTDSVSLPRPKSISPILTIGTSADAVPVQLRNPFLTICRCSRG